MYNKVAFQQMLVQIRIPNHVKEAIDRLVSDRLYPDFNSAAVIALENLLVAEAEDAANSTASSKAEHIGPQISDKISTALRWEGRLSVPPACVRGIQFSPQAIGTSFPVEQWLFGQRNRVFPVKVNARLLLNACSKTSEPLLREIVDTIASEAALVGAELLRIDRLRDHKKEDLYSTGFPAADSDKSRQRFGDQFVTSENKKGELSGMMTDWGFAVAEHANGKTFLFPTESCVAFANLVNPLLDVPTAQISGNKFSEAELEWVLKHVSERVPVEAYAFRTLLRGIDTGSNDPTKLDHFLRREKLVSSPKTSQDYLATQRAGAISRMVDLDIIRRVRDGVRITYALTQRGAVWLSAST